MRLHQWARLSILLSLGIRCSAATDESSQPSLPIGELNAIISSDEEQIKDIKKYIPVLQKWIQREKADDDAQPAPPKGFRSICGDGSLVSLKEQLQDRQQKLAALQQELPKLYAFQKETTAQVLGPPAPKNNPPKAP